MQSDDFDKKIKTAAENHHPTYEESAWGRMEKLLDKNMPVKKDDRRRIIFFLLFLLLAGGGAYLLISKPGQPKTTIANTKNTTALQNKSVPVSASIEQDQSTDNKTISTATTVKDNTAVSEADVKNEPVKDQVDATKDTKINQHYQDNKKRSDFKKSTLKVPVSTKENKLTYKKSAASTYEKNSVSKISVKKKGDASFHGNTINNNNTTPLKDNTVTADAGNIPAGNTKVDKTIESVINNPDSTQNVKAATTENKQEEKNSTVANKKENKKIGRKKNSSFGITFSLGPDVSAVGLSKIGTMKMSYGAGLSYSFKRFTVRSGFYVAKKVYSAGPDDYHPPKHYWTYYVDLTKVDADCKVYEIPLTFSYNFVQAKNHNWFASAGLSSFMMKKEVYNYSYKDGTGQPGYRSWTLDNGGNHLFSILDLSAGYERKLNKNISIIAEPYFKVPLEEIGFGNIKLNSAGILFTLTVKPFNKK